MLYNARYRGPMEYDKFMLMLIHNAAKVSETSTYSINNEELGGLKQLIHKINLVFHEYTKENNPSELLLKESLRRSGFNGNS